MPISVLLAVVGAVLLFGVLRYGKVYLGHPQILIEASLVFFLVVNLIRTRQQGLTLALVVAGAFTIRNVFDLTESWVAIINGAEYSKIRIEENYFGGISTGQSAWRSVLLPIFLALMVYSRKRHERLIFGSAVISIAAWLGISRTLTAVASVVICALLLVWLIPRDRRANILRWLTVVAVVWLLAALTFPIMLRGTIQDLETALTGFARNPLWGSRSGPHHSYLLGRSQEMGLLFLAPFGLTLWTIWRHSRRMRRLTLAPTMLALVIGIQAAVLLAIFHNLVGTAWQLGEYAFLFWLLVGVHEALYVRYSGPQKLNELPQRERFSH